MKLGYRKKIFLYLGVVFTLFTICIIVFERGREKVYKTETLETNLDVYAEVIHKYMEESRINSENSDELKHLLPLFPENIRVTIINNDGKVVFDNDISNTSALENHKDRPEIKKALVKNSGTNIRQSSSMHKEFLYYAKHYDGYFIRTALPYDVEVKNFLKPDSIFLYFMLLLFFIVLLAIFYLSNRFGKSIEKLKDFIAFAQDGNPDLNNISFPHDELGDIGNKIVDLYKEVQVNKKKITMEREKLLQHFQSSQEGLCFFTPKRKKIYANSHFIQYLNLLTDKPTLSVNYIFEDTVFIDLQDYLDNKSTISSNLFETKLSKNGKHFRVAVVRFDDGSFEITINDVTKLEKTRLLKQEMTNNIAHELRTPITSIRGYIETLREQPGIEPDKRQLFLDRAFSQIARLSELVRDISFITRMEEAADMYEIENVSISQIIKELQSDLADKLKEQWINFEVKVPENVVVNGNRVLLYSIFRNLADNTVAYAGEGVEICIDNYMEDDDYYYFSYYDTGNGVEEKHLVRLFERFYRVNEGRTRDTGGSGLGLSIVKNAVIFHKGQIVAKNRKGGGLEFLFTLKKN